MSDSSRARRLKVGGVAGGFLLVGVVVGLMFSLRMDWVAPANSSPAITSPALSPASAGQSNFVPVVKAVMPAVVNISTTRVIHGKDMQQMSPFFNDPFFRQFFGDQFPQGNAMPRDQRENSLGSGVIVDGSGYIVTNNHVVDKADEIKVLLGDKREFIGKVVGTDPKTDIAVIRIQAKDLPSVPWGDSDRLEVGEYVLAMGNPFGLNQTVTMGIVSAVGRANVGIADYEDFIQTDAAINPGNSGGALVNTRGELMGINTAIFSRNGGYMGVGFAVPSNMVRKVMQSLIDKGKVVRGWLGVSIQELTPELARNFGVTDAKGALVGEVVKDSPAAKAGFIAGDVIVAMDGKPIDSPTSLRNRVADMTLGKDVAVRVIRDKKPTELKAKIAEQPADLEQAAVGDSGGQSGGNSVLAGLEVQAITPDIARQLGLAAGNGGVVVSGVDAASPAAASGVRRGDVIVEINRAPVHKLGDYQRLVNKLGKKDNVLLLINRGGGKLFVLIKP
jgi:serine protease Do